MPSTSRLLYCYSSTMIRVKTSDVPLYKQIVEQISRLVASERWPPGHRLPSVRGLAEQLVINHNTVARAYRELERQGLVTSRRGDGVFVADQSHPFARRRVEQQLQVSIERLFDEATQLGLSPEALVKLVDGHAAKRVRQVPADDETGTRRRA